MSLVTVAIAVHADDPGQLQRCVESIPSSVVERIVVLCSPGDVESLRSVTAQGLELYVGAFGRERDKRNELLVHARGRGDAPSCEWVLMLDPDEELVNAERLPDVLAGADPLLPAYPLIRQEPSGECWSMPCKLIRGDVDSFIYLDVAVRWPCYGALNANVETRPQQSWNLDPYEVGYAVPIAGWPHLVHYRSARADTGGDPGDAGFYEEGGELLETERVFREELPDPPGVVIVARR